MSKKSKNKKKRVNPKKEKYAKFRKEKISTTNFAVPEITPEYQKQKLEDERKIDMFLRYNRNAPTKEVNERRMRSKR